MKNELLTYQLKKYREEVLDIPKNDILANLQDSKSVRIEFELEKNTLTLQHSSLLHKLYRESIQYKKESNTETLCVSLGVLNWENQQSLLQTPLILFPASCKYSKLTQSYHLEFDFSVFELNPYIQYTLKEKFDLILPKPQSTENGTGYFLQLISFLKQHGFNDVVNSSFLANFHPHRFAILKDLDGLLELNSYSSLIHTILGDSDGEVRDDISLEETNLFPCDISQLAVFKTVKKSNCVVQGPPGTGKSQVLSNLLGKLLSGNHKSLIVSEKAVALLILVQKLNSFQLDKFAFISHKSSTSNLFIEQLKDTWNFLEKFSFKETNNVFTYNSLIHEFQQTFDRLNSIDLTGGIKIKDYKRKIVNTEITVENISKYCVSITSLNYFKNDLALLFKNDGLINLSKHIHKSVYQQNNFFEKTILDLIETYTYLNNQFSFETISGLEKWLKKSIISQFISHPLFSLYDSLYVSDTKVKKFIKTKNDYTKYSAEFELKKRTKTNWKVEPSLSLALAWKKSINENLSWYKKRKLLKEIDSFLTVKTPYFETILDEWIDFLMLESNVNETKHKLFTLGIEYPENELPQLELLHFQFNSFAESDWIVVKKLEKSTRDNLIKAQPKIKDFLLAADTYFKKLDQVNLNEFFNLLACYLNDLQLSRPIFEKLPDDVYQILADASSFDELEQQVLYANFERIKTLFPSLTLIEARDLQQRIEQILRVHEQEAKQFSTKCIQDRANRFNEYHHLMSTSPLKLDAATKQFRAELKRGKAILVKEFTKSKRYLSIRELLESDCKHWIDLLCPIFLSTPAQVAEIFPLKKDLFSCLLIDEASQIPVSHALGALQRSKRVIIAGDEQQMAPNFYFSSKQERVDILQQASYHLEKVALRYHYRSQHPALIAFSNRYFYGNSLHTFPAYPHNKEALKHYFIPNGVFENRVNSFEAKALVEQLVDALKTTKRIGVVAFSESQLEEIQKHIPSHLRDVVEELQDNDMLFFKALEHVQGDECDDLFISLGYAKDSTGHFHMRFGPLNRKNGSKRLNVLFSRAKHQIHFFSSVKSEDFQVSSNEAIDLLRKFIYSLENQNQSENEISFPFDFSPEIKGSKLIIHDAETHFNDVQDLITFYNVLKNRGWEVALR